MPELIYKQGSHRNEDALDNVINYMFDSRYAGVHGGRGIFGYSTQGIIEDFEFTKQMYEKDDRKQVTHIIIGTKNEGLCELDMIERAEAASEFFYDKGFQNVYVIHTGSRSDPRYMHVHMAVNTINYMDGKRLTETYSNSSELYNHMKDTFEDDHWKLINDSCKNAV